MRIRITENDGYEIYEFCTFECEEYSRFFKDFLACKKVTNNKPEHVKKLLSLKYKDITYKYDYDKIDEVIEYEEVRNVDLTTQIEYFSEAYNNILLKAKELEKEIREKLTGFEKGFYTYENNKLIHNVNALSTRCFFTSPNFVINYKIDNFEFQIYNNYRD